MSDNVFKLARTKYNQHGPQSVETVVKLTGISKTMIDDLESSVGKKRGVSYLKVAELAKHYGVSSDYLLGLDPTPNPNANIRNLVKKIGLSVSSLAVLKKNRNQIDSPQIPAEKLSDYQEDVNTEIELCAEIDEIAKKEGWEYNKNEALLAKKQEIFEEYTEPEVFSAELFFHALNTLIEKEDETHILHNMGLFLNTGCKKNERFILTINDDKRNGYFYSDTAITSNDLAQIFLLNIQSGLHSLRSKSEPQYHISDLSGESEEWIEMHN